MKITLADGSIVTLNTASRIETRMNGQERTVRLLEGEAFFEVAHDATRPFRVYAGDGMTVAVGTAFSVRLNKNAVEVVVSEGKVAYSRVADTPTPETIAYVTAGETASFGEGRRWVMPGPEYAGIVTFYEDFPYAWWNDFKQLEDLNLAATMALVKQAEKFGGINAVV